MIADNSEIRRRAKELRIIARQQSLVNYKFLGEFAGRWLFEQERGLPSEVVARFDFTPESRGRHAAMSFAKIGSVVFGPVLPDGVGESIYRIVSRKGKKQVLVCLRDGRADDRTQVGISHKWHADNNIVVFGRAKRGEIVSLRNKGVI
jgi:hypothetical protein